MTVPCHLEHFLMKYYLCQLWELSKLLFFDRNWQKCSRCCSERLCIKVNLQPTESFPCQPALELISPSYCLALAIIQYIVTIHCSGILLVKQTLRKYHDCKIKFSDKTHLRLTVLSAATFLLHVLKCSLGLRHYCSNLSEKQAHVGRVHSGGSSPHSFSKTSGIRLNSCIKSLEYETEQTWILQCHWLSRCGNSSFLWLIHASFWLQH